MFTIGIVTDKMEYVEEEFIVKNHVLTAVVAARISSIFAKYSFDKHSDICMTDETMLDNALTQYLRVVALHYNIRLEILHDAAIFQRLVNMHVGLVGRKWREKHLLRWQLDKSKNFTPKNIDLTKLPSIQRKLWNTFLRKKICPWIDADVDLSISLGKARFKKQRQRVRLAAYYLVCRRYMKLRNQKVQA